MSCAVKLGLFAFDPNPKVYSVFAVPWTSMGGDAAGALGYSLRLQCPLDAIRPNEEEGVRLYSKLLLRGSLCVGHSLIFGRQDAREG